MPSMDCGYTAPRKPLSWNKDLDNYDRIRFKNLISNGCGSKGGKIKPPFSRFFKASCDAHDFGYQVGGDKRQRKVVDAKFYGAMVADAAGQPLWAIPHFLIWATIYYASVRICGGKSFTAQPPIDKATLDRFLYFKEFGDPSVLDEGELERYRL